MLHPSDAPAAGTPGFQAPEQRLGNEVPASDLYSPGATLFFLLSGRAPAAADADRDRTTLLSALGISKDFAGLLLRLLQQA